MKNLKNSSDVAGHSNSRNEKPQKHDANLQKNSGLYFQVGLILCLLLTYGLFEMHFEPIDYNLAKVDYDHRDAEYVPEIFKVEKKIGKKIDDSRKTVVLTKDPIVKEDDYVEPKLEILTDPEPYVVPIEADRIVIVDAPELDVAPEIFDVSRVEQVPIYPGCEFAKNNDERRSCMSGKLSALIQKQFDTRIASELGLSGIQKIYVQFKIDKTGMVTDILSRAPFKQLENETERVLKKVPKMIPGKQRYKPVTVTYSLPIIFDVH